MRRVLAAVGSCAVLALGLVACGASSAPQESQPADTTEWGGTLYERTIKLDDGRLVTCLMTSPGGIDCDFDGVEQAAR